MFSVNGFRYLAPREVDVGRCPYFNRTTLENECFGEPVLACWNPKLETMGVPKQPDHYQKCPIYAQIGKKEFVLGRHTATRTDLMDKQMHQNGLQKYGISPVEYMELADITRGEEGAHILTYRGRIFTAIVRGSGEIDSKHLGIIRTIRRGFPSKSTTLPVIDHREFAPVFPYSTVMN